MAGGRRDADELKGGGARRGVGLTDHPPHPDVARADDRGPSGVEIECHLITCEYPPRVGGVSDFTRMVAAGMAETGAAVRVWCPDVGGAVETPGVDVRERLGGLSPADLVRADRELSACPGPRRLLVQWVPHGYGYLAMNVPFCLWILKRARVDGDAVEVVVHEPYLPFAGSWKQRAVAVVHRGMLAVLGAASSKIWISTPAWEEPVRPFVPKRVPIRWVAIPSSIEIVHDAGRVAEIRDRYRGAEGRLVGHFSTCGGHVAHALESSLPPLLESDDRTSVVLVGLHSKRLREAIVAKFPRLGARLHATGPIDAHEVSAYIAACDVMVQPCMDGVTSRNGSVMASLAHGRPIVTTKGRLTESLWESSGAVALAPDGDARALVEAARRLLDDPEERARLSNAARALYRERFDVRSVARTLSA